MNDNDFEIRDLTPEEERLAAKAISMRKRLVKYQHVAYWVIDDNGGVACDTLEKVRKYLSGEMV